MVLANAAANVAAVIGVIVVGGWLIYVFANVRQGRREVGSEVVLAPNRKPYYDDEVLEGPRLERALGFGLGALVIVAVGLPLYWLAEPGRQAGAAEAHEEQLVAWGAALFATTEAGGFNCAGCHGAQGVGGVANYTLTDPVTGEVRIVEWKAPNLQTTLYLFSEEEVEEILVYGRPFSPMSAWGLDGGGPMTEQQIESLIAYIRSIQITPEEAAERVAEGLEEARARNPEATDGELLFNLETGQGSYNCARCHTRGWSFNEPEVSGGGAFGPNLTGGSTVRQFPDAADQELFIEQGSERGRVYGVNGLGSGRMPGFGEVLTPEQIQAIVEYERSL